MLIAAVVIVAPYGMASGTAGYTCVDMGVGGRPILACAELMPNTIPFSAAPEGFAFTAQGRAIVGLDMRKPCRNLVLLDPRLAQLRGRG